MGSPLVQNTMATGQFFYIPCKIRRRHNRRLKLGIRTRLIREARPTREQGQKRSSVVVASGQANPAIRMKLNLAKSLDRLDLSNCDLEEIPMEVFELENLRDLSLAGNRISSIPEEIGNLVMLERFVIAGNLLESLPDSIGKLKNLEGFWCHGNLINRIPNTFGDLESLKKCSLSGNQIQELPSTIGKMTQLEVLEVAGNRLHELPTLVGGLKSLKNLIVHGNQIKELPPAIELCSCLESIMIQGNCLVKIANSFSFPESLKVLNMADNSLEVFDADLGTLPNLETLVLYGNSLEYIPQIMLGLPKLKNFWLEGNPIEPYQLNGWTNQSVWSKSLQKLGLDEDQLESSDFNPPGVVQECEVCCGGPGYFKLEKRSSNLLVVAFGSAPGEPNWAGLLGRVGKDAGADTRNIFDTLYVVDPRREWFGGCGDGFQYYYDTLKAVAERYDACVMIGESMGASAALMFSSLATTVLAFCPQVDLSFSSIRPGVDYDSWEILRARVMDGVSQSEAEIRIMSGTWQHDIKQVQQLDQSKIKWKAYDVDSHRLAVYLDLNQKLVPLVRSALGIRGKTAQIANLV